MKEPTSFMASSKANMKRKGPSKTAEGVVLHRVFESQKPEGERICYDPYASYFISSEMVEFATKHPDEAKEAWEQYERLIPGLGNSIAARVKYFDDFVENSINEGFEQLVILGSGYDTRPYRIEGLKGKVRIFEVDHPETQRVKIEKIKEIFGLLPNHVVYVSADLETEELGQQLANKGYNRSQKTLFIMEGVVIYIPPRTVDEILSFIVKNSGKGSVIIFDYFSESVIDGTCKLAEGKNMRKHVEKLGEPLQFGIKEGTVEMFLAERGFSKIQNVTSEDYKRAYFHGINENRVVFSLLSFVHAVV